jgi:hypothetical protein
MAAAKLLCIHQPGDGKQLLTRVRKKSDIVRMNESKSIGSHEFLGSISKDTLDGKTSIESGFLHSLKQRANDE